MMEHADREDQIETVLRPEFTDTRGLEVDALARRTRMCDWSEWEGPRPKTRSGMQIFLNDGRKLEATLDGYHRYWGSKDYEKLLAKFRRNIEFSRLVEETAVDELISAIENLDTLVNINEFVEKWLVFEK